MAAKIKIFDSYHKVACNNDSHWFKKWSCDVASRDQELSWSSELRACSSSSRSELEPKLETE